MQLPDYNFFIHKWEEYVRDKARVGGQYVIYSPRGRAASEGFRSHKARVRGLYLTYFIIEEVFFHDFLVLYYFEFEILEFFASFLSQLVFKNFMWYTARGTSKKTDSMMK